jgi:PhnB protein
MAARLNPYVAFNGNAREALEFYRDVLGGELEIGTFNEFGAADVMAADKIMHAVLTTPDGFLLMAWDVPERVPFHPGNNVALYLGGDDPALRGYFERLSVGGIVTMPLEKQVWGDEAGSFIDQFGISWMININRRQP